MGRGALTVTPKPGPGPPGTGSGAPGTHGSLHPTAPSPVHAPASTALHVVLSVGPGWVPGQAGSGQPGTRTSHTTSPSVCPGARAAEPAPPAPSPAAAVALRGAPSAGLPPRGALRGFYCRDAPCPAAAPPAHSPLPAPLGDRPPPFLPPPFLASWGRENRVPQGHRGPSELRPLSRPWLRLGHCSLVTESPPTQVHIHSGVVTPTPAGLTEPEHARH